MSRRSSRTARRTIVPLAFALSLGLALSVGCDGCRGTVAKPEENYALTMDEILLEVADRVPEFGGMFLDDDGALNIFLTDTSKLAEAEAAIVAEFGSEVIPAAGVVALEADYRFQQLFQWHRAHRMETLVEPGVVSVSIQEMTNRVKVRVESEDARGRVEGILTAAGVPLEAAEIVLSAPVVSDQPQLTDTSRPLIGGQGVGRPVDADSVFACTLGVLAVRDGVAGFVTNSHCQAGRGGLLGSVWHQVSPASDASNQIGTELVDPDWVGGGDCPSGKKCRRSDSAFVARSVVDGFAPPTARWDAIALPSNFSGGGMTIDNFVRIRREDGHPACGQSVQRVGRSTGAMTGKITDTCCDVITDEPGFVLLCQTLYDRAGAGGDSGAPVFTWSSASLPRGAKPVATLFGIHWGSTPDGESGIFSPIHHVEAELGSLRTHRFEGGANSAPAVEIVEPRDNEVVGVGGLAIETYTAAVSDWEDGEGCCTVSWESDVDGPMGGGAELPYAFASQGDRRITVTVTDSAGASATDTITVTTRNDAPTVEIQWPPDGAILSTGATYTLQGSGYDLNEPFQALACNQLVWTSSHAADTWQIPECDAEVSFDSAGSRTIKLTGTDSGGLEDTATVGIVVEAPQPGALPEVEIKDPRIDSAHDANATLMLRGRVFDTNSTGRIQGQISYEWILTPLAGTNLVGGASSISIGSGTAWNNQIFQTPWVPSQHVLGSPGGKAVRLTLRGTDADGTKSTHVRFVVMFPPS